MKPIHKKKKKKSGKGKCEPCTKSKPTKCFKQVIDTSTF